MQISVTGILLKPSEPFSLAESFFVGMLLILTLHIKVYCEDSGTCTCKKFKILLILTSHGIKDIIAVTSDTHLQTV